MSNIRVFRRFAFSLLCAAAAATAHAQTPDAPTARPNRLLATIVDQPRQVGGDDGPEGWCGGVREFLTNESPAATRGNDIDIVVTYDPNVPAAWRTIVNFAVAEWESVLRSRGVNPGTYPITASAADLGGGILAQMRTFWNGSGALIRAELEIDSSNRTWFVDPTPAEDGDVASAPSGSYDLLAVIRHEVGHAVGWLGTNNPRVANLTNGDVFDAGRLNIALNPGDAAHADGSAHPSELMRPSTGPRTRRAIALYPTAARVARNFQYDIPMQFCDSAFGGSSNGSATSPWGSFAQAIANGRSDFPILLAPRQFPVTAGSTFSAPRTIISARGGATVSP